MSKLSMKTLAKAWNILGFATVGILLISAPARSEPFLLPVQGGGGGGGFFAVCPPDHFVVGLRGRTGAWIDNMRLICARGGVPSLGAPFDHGFVIGNSVGGADDVAQCPQNTFVKNIRFNVVNTHGDDGFVVINTIKLTCFNNNGEFVAFRHLARDDGPHDADGHPVNSSLCPGNPRMALIGLHGRHGLFVDAIGAVCDRY